jgi:hypothetical protein
MTDFTTNPGTPPTADAPREPTCECGHEAHPGKVCFDELYELSGVTYRCMCETPAASPSLGELGTLLDEYGVAMFKAGKAAVSAKANRRCDHLRAALDARLSALVAEREAAVEVVAEMIYDKMRANDTDGQRHPWTPRGNSLKQDEARYLARAKLRAAHPPEGSHGR